MGVGQVKAILAMVRGGARCYKENLDSYLQFEQTVNKRWQGIRSGDSAAKRQRAAANTVRADAPPWLASANSKSRKLAYLADVVTRGYLPPSLTAIPLMRALNHNLKSADNVTLSGPLGKIVLVDLLPKEGNRESKIEVVLFRYMDIISDMWLPVISHDRLVELKKELQECLAELEWVLPSAELDINRHMMLHLVDAMLLHGPLWAFSMFRDERFWKELTDMCANPARPAASILRKWRANMVAFRAIQSTPEGVGQNVPLAFTVTEADDGGLLFPRYEDFERLSVSVGPFYGSRVLGWKEKSGYPYTLEVHDLLVKNPDLVRSCPHRGSPSEPCLLRQCSEYRYDKLWQKFVEYKVAGAGDSSGGATRVSRNTRKDWLREWPYWARQKYPPEVALLCDGPSGRLHLSYTAQVGMAKLKSFESCQTQQTKPCIIMVHHDGVQTFGRVEAFGKFLPPGAAAVAGESPWDCHIVICKWYRPLGVDHQTQLPLVHAIPTELHDDGNMWPLVNVAPVEVGLVPHWSRRNVMVAVSKFRSFRDFGQPDRP
jgi:hypothetical protein